jgi:GNAT superfamily N-acetyltransferase
MLSIRTLTGNDLPVARRLKDQAGWNQTDADLQRFLELAGEGFFLAELDGQPVGSTATFIFDDVAWVALVLVDPAFRGRGIGTALMEHALGFLDRRGVRSIRLDATPLGRPIYEKLGFEAEFELARYEGVLPPWHGVAEVEPLGRESWPAVVALDRQVTGTKRDELLARLYAEAPAAFWVVRAGSGVGGYLAARPGCRAWQLGPCIAEPDAGPRLFADARHRLAGQRVYLDIPLANAAARAFPEGLGWKVQRPFLRMGRGSRVHEDLHRLWASSGPEKG